MIQHSGETMKGHKWLVIGRGSPILDMHNEGLTLFFYPRGEDFGSRNPRYQCLMWDTRDDYAWKMVREQIFTYDDLHAGVGKVRTLPAREVSPIEGSHPLQ